MDALEAFVELPQFAAQLVGCLSDERSSNRALALRALARLEPPTLALHARALEPALKALEPHEAASEAAERLLRTLALGTQPIGPCVSDARRDGEVSEAADVAAVGARDAGGGGGGLPPNDLRRRLSSVGAGAGGASAKRARCR